MIKTNAVITAIAPITGDDGADPVYQDLTLPAPIPCELLTISVRRAQSLSANGLEASKAALVLAGHISRLTTGTLEDAVVTVSYTVAGEDKSDRYVVVRSEFEPDAAAVGQNIYELLLNPGGDGANILEAGA